MIKRVSLVRRREGLTHEEFVAHWTGPHAAIVRELPGVRGLRFGDVQAWSPADAVKRRALLDMIRDWDLSASGVVTGAS